MQCDKCGSWRMHGPRYVWRNGYEVLKYVCWICGAEATMPTQDSVVSLQSLQERLRRHLTSEG